MKHRAVRRRMPGRWLPGRRAAVRGVAVFAVVACVAAGTVVAIGTARATPHESAAANRAVSMQVVGDAAQQATLAYWTRARMATATSSPAFAAHGKAGKGSAAGSDGRSGSAKGDEPPAGTPDPVTFSGVPTVGPLFYTTGAGRHFCTASVVASSAGSLVMTAAHCVYSSSAGYSKNLEFVPGYANGTHPEGEWPVKEIFVASGWRTSQDPKLDVAFLEVVTPSNSVGPIQIVTGGLKLAFGLPDAQHVTVIGYNNTSQAPILCTTNAFRVKLDTMEMYCRSFWIGTSGGPWIIGYRSGKGTGTVYGVIGGYEAGGYESWASYSPALEQPAEQLFNQANATASAQPAT
ncbi:MAG TPA: trypsin-like serine protease [Streptosporangiaceae bacterium]|jgi:V8-like Glu-specific endopeptidase|nr:trypsin-like serine protease [Streptosporangiaceae bacterium]